MCSSHTQLLWRMCLARKVKNPVLAVKNNTCLNDGINVEDESKNPVEQRKHIFWQTSMNDHRPKLRVYINGIIIEGLLDTSVEVSLL